MENNIQIEEKYKILLEKDFISTNNIEEKELLQKLHVNNFFIIFLIINRFYRIFYHQLQKFLLNFRIK